MKACFIAKSRSIDPHIDCEGPELALSATEGWPAFDRFNYSARRCRLPEQFNTKFRQAILYAINRQSIIENLYKGAATPVSCLYNSPAYVPADIEKFEYNPEKAAQLLQESGVDLAALGDLEMSTYYGDQLSLDVMTAIQQDLAAVGIKVTPRQMDSAAAILTRRYLLVYWSYR